MNHTATKIPPIIAGQPRRRFEREFRKGLEILIEVPQLKIGISSLVWISRMRNFAEKSECSTLGPGWCQSLWTTAVSGALIGLPTRICESLTADCSGKQIRDAQGTGQAYRDILDKVTQEYGTIPAGGISPVVTTAGETIGEASKAAEVQLNFSNASSKYKSSGEQLPWCDCFHPSSQRQYLTTRTLFDGSTCSETNVCRSDNGDALVDGLRTKEEARVRFVPGLF